MKYQIPLHSVTDAPSEVTNASIASKPSSHWHSLPLDAPPSTHEAKSGHSVSSAQSPKTCATWKEYFSCTQNIAITKSHWNPLIFNCVGGFFLWILFFFTVQFAKRFTSKSYGAVLHGFLYLYILFKSQQAANYLWPVPNNLHFLFKKDAKWYLAYFLCGAFPCTPNETRIIN